MKDMTIVSLAHLMNTTEEFQKLGKDAISQGTIRSDKDLKNIKRLQKAYGELMDSKFNFFGKNGLRKIKEKKNEGFLTINELQE